ncbi:MAG: Ldh family oxidoreductase [Desulfovibrionaceae bacterium]|nr:Ldh family oxidoreductase [Desulfovibrionaceae bacterium]
MKIFDPERVKKTMRANLEKTGVCAESCFHVTESMVQTSLRGIDSHGIGLFPHYHSVALSGRITKEPAFVVERTGPSTAVLDAQSAFGHHAGWEAMKHAVAIAKETGVGTVSVKNSTHFGAAYYFAFQAAEENHVGMAFTNVNNTVMAYNATRPMFGTNPICLAAPMLGEGPFCLDMATSAIAKNTMINHKRTLTPLEPGWCMDADGRPTLDPQAACYLGPSGGYKGYGLGMMVDIFCGMLSGCGIGPEVVPMFENLNAKRNVSHFFMSIDIARFQDPAAFKARLKALADAIRAMPSVDPGVPVMIPGDPEKQSFARRSAEGIPADEAKYKEFLAVDPGFADALRT